MADPIIIDDGGSIRIRQIGGSTNLDGLLTPPFSVTVNTTFTKVHVGHHSKDGDHHPHPSGAPNGDTNFSSSDSVTIRSLGGTIVVTATVSSSTLTISLSGAVVQKRTDPSGQVVYLITNAGLIESVDVGSAGNIFPRLARPSTLPSVLTMVVLK